MPALAAQPCQLFTLGDMPTQADLEVGYERRGTQLVTCDAARQLAVDTAAAEHKLADEIDADRAKRARPFWRFW